MVEWHSPSLKCSTTCRYEKNKSAPRKKNMVSIYGGIGNEVCQLPARAGSTQKLLDNQLAKIGLQNVS